MRLVWWTIFLTAGCVSAAGAQSSLESATALSSAPGLRMDSKLRVHKLEDDQMTSFLVGDDLRTDEDGLTTLEGGAEVRRIDSVVKGDRIDYRQSTGDVRVRGNGLIMRDGSIVKGPDLKYNLDSETGEVQDPNFWLVSSGAGEASKADIFSRDHMRLADVTYSGCPCPEPSWYIKSSRVDLHFDENEGIARHGLLYFKGMPILYSPYLTFPLRKERKSGFLLPTYGTSSKGGFEFTLPYYFNIAPNYDATLTPRYMSKRGLQMGGEFRYLGERYSGDLYGTYLAKDQLDDRKRWMYILRHQHRLGGGFSAAYDVRRVSDDNYFRDFSSFGINEATMNQLPSSARLNWSGYKYFRAYLQTYTYQTLQDEDDRYVAPAYDKLPELSVTAERYNWGGFDVVSDNYATRFERPYYSGVLSKFDPYREGGPLADYGTNRTGSRFSSYTTVAYPIVKAGWYVTPKAGLHMSQYHTDWYPGVADRPRTQSRVLPIMSLDSGMTFERDTSLFGNAAIQTLEPRAYYLYVPYKDQSELPVYDTSLAAFNFAQAFDENIFSGGWDRIADANQLTLGLTTRWLDGESGFERLSLSAAQRIYFRDRLVTLYDKGRTNKKSDYLVGMNAALTDTLNVRFDAQFNPESRDRNRMAAGFRWEPKRLASLAASYRYERDPRQIDNPNFVFDPENNLTREQISVTGQWPLSNGFYALGRYDYSLAEKRSTQSIFGLEYKGDCCWAARVVFQRYAVSASDYNTAMFFQLELSGLGSLGTDPMRLLRDRIGTYQSITPPIPDTTTFERYE